MRKDYRIIVIGGGHAGVEAAWAAANLLCTDADPRQKNRRSEEHTSELQSH